MAEVYRAGIEAVPGGQMEAARSLGMSYGTAMRHVIVPQAIRKVIPPLLNDFIALMKDTTLVSVIGLIEVVQAGRDIQSETLNSSGLMLGALMFILVTIPLARLVDWMIARHDTGLLPEVDMWARAGDDSIFDMARDGQRFPVHQILQAADLVGRPETTCDQLVERLSDEDAAVRYWAAAGLICPRGRTGWLPGKSYDAL